MGAWFRLGGDSTEFDSRNIFGIRYGVAAWYAPEDLYSVGLAFETAGLGGGQRAEGLDSIDIEYGVSTVWAGARAYPFRRGPLALFVLLRVGASFQRLDANGIRATSNITVPAETFQCSAGQGPGFALGGSVGVDVTLNEQIAFLGQVDAAAHRLSSDVIDGCARGVGSVSSLGFGLGLAYRFGIGH